MHKTLTLTHLLSWQIRFFLYLSSLSSLFFMQTYCTNVCPFIDGLQPLQITRNLGFVFIIHIVFRELLYNRFNLPWKNITLPRQAYRLSIISWLLAGIVALILHAYLYPNFPFGSHLKLLSSYWILGGGILAQLEYIIFEQKYKKIAPIQEGNYHENIAQRFLESFFLFTLAPSLVLLLVVARYNYQGVIDKHVLIEVIYIAIFFISFALLNAYLFGKMLTNDTRKIISAVDHIKQENFETSIQIVRPDELGQIAQAINGMTHSIRQGIQEIENLNQEIMETQKEVVYTMGAIAEERSKETGNHVKRVAAYSELLALKIGLSQEEAKLLRLASPMHDIGKVAIPDNILNKPGKHTEEEFEIMKTHAQIGHEMLKYSNRIILKSAAIVAHEHHEKYDGTGYPRGLKGEDIHIYGRITALADVFDALGSDRIYKKAWNDEDIFSLIREQSGKHFDPILVELFFNHFDEINVIREMYRDIS